MAASHVVLQGSGPFHLPRAHRATARALATSVEVTLCTTLEGREGNREAVSFHLPAAPARELAIRLLEAVRKIERRGGAT